MSQRGALNLGWNVTITSIRRLDPLLVVFETLIGQSRGQGGLAGLDYTFLLPYHLRHLPLTFVNARVGGWVLICNVCGDGRQGEDIIPL